MSQTPSHAPTAEAEQAGEPSCGDVVMARFRWRQDGAYTEGRKIRPCVIIRTSREKDSVIVVPISSSPSDVKTKSRELSAADKASAGLPDSRRSWAQTEHVNRIDLPTSTIIPCQVADGRLAWSRGRVTDTTLAALQSDIAHGINDNTLKGVRIPRSSGTRLHVAAARRVDSGRARQDAAPDAQPNGDTPRSENGKTDRERLIAQAAFRKAQKHRRAMSGRNTAAREEDVL